MKPFTLKPFPGEEEGEALLANVLDRPEDDASRLVLSDWLEEHGELAWAELIRTQVASHREEVRTNKLSPPTRDAENEAFLRFKKAHPTGVHVNLYLHRNRDYTDEHGDVAVHRGFIYRVVTTPGRWKTIGPTLVRRHPVEEVRILDLSPMVVERPSERRLNGGPFGYMFYSDAFRPAHEEMPAGAVDSVVWAWYLAHREEMESRPVAVALLAYGRDSVMFDTEEDAQDWLDEVHLKWARKESECLTNRPTTID